MIVSNTPVQEEIDYYSDPTLEGIAYNLRTIRSHRRIRVVEFSPRRIAATALVLTLVSGTVTTSVSLSTPATPAVKAVAPLLLADPGFSVDEPSQTSEPTVERTGAERGSRAKPPPAPPKAPVTKKPATTSAPASSGSGSSKLERVIKFALAQQGRPYSWAQSGPYGYDCSGLVLRSFAQVGVKLPHFTGTLMGKGSKVSRSDMRRGDLVFPSSGHVGIYLGNNMMVHASSSKGRVVVAKVYSFYTARRIL